MYVGIKLHKKIIDELDNNAYYYLKSLTKTNIKYDEFKRLTDYYYEKGIK